MHDLAIHPREHDLVIATHGRGVYILDDLTPLRHLGAEVVESEVALLPVLIIYILGQNWFVQGITLSGLGGR